MTKPPEFDRSAAHRYFSVSCFNHAWDLIKKQGRTPDEDEEMLRLSLASTWHWTQRHDCTPTNLSVGYWQTAHIYTLLGQLENARRYGRLCLEAGQEDGAELFALGYAYEALARAEMAAGEGTQMEIFLQQARLICERMTDLVDRQQLLKDLETITLGQ
jgi:hypothetical protein